VDHLDIPDQIKDMTKHAAARCNQRGIRAEVVDFVLTHFDRDHHAGAGAVAVSISRRHLARLQLDGVPARLTGQAACTVLIIGDDGAIITAINRPTWYARFHHGADRLGHRRRSRRRRGSGRSR
jgi:hypothetical protein